MKSRPFVMMKALQSGALAIILALASSSFAAQDKKDQPPQVSKGEQEAGQKVEAAADIPAKLKAAGEFIKKYPKSTQRATVVGYVVQEINKTADPAQKITFLENSLTIFKEQGDVDIINPILIDAYIKEKRLDDAFRVASAAVAKNPNDISSMSRMAIVGVEEAKRGNAKYVEQSQQFALKSIEIIESGKKPDNIDEAGWQDFQVRVLAQLYQSVGVISMMTSKKDEAKTRFEKAATVNPNDPFTYVLLAYLVNEEYQKVAEQHKAQSAGPLKDELLNQAHKKMDQVIELYAQAVAMAEGKEIYKQLHDQIFEDLQTYYRYRHAGTTDGLKELIAKYKK